MDTKASNLILNENSGLTVFFDILQKISKLEDFGLFNNYLFETAHLFESEDFLKNKKSNTFGEKLDLQIGFTNNTSDDLYETFLIKKYNKNFYDDRQSLFPLNSTPEIDLDSKNLVISRYKFFENLSKNEFRKKLKLAYQKSQDLIKNLSI